MLRYLPPSGVPIRVSDIFAGLCSSFSSRAVQTFREEVCRYFGVRYCFLASSGRAGLSMLLQALHHLHPERNEVLLPAFTSFSVPSAVVHAGLHVSLYDLEENTLSPSLESLGAAINSKTLCIVVCHLYGYPCDMDAVMEQAGKAGVPVIDDAAQAMGASCGGRMVGTCGDAGLFSLSRGKNISAVDGGIMVTNDQKLAQELEACALEPYGIVAGAVLVIKALVLSLLLHPIFYGIPARLPFLNIGASVFEPDFPLKRFTSFQAAIGARMLGRLNLINEARRAKAHMFMDRFSSAVSFPEIVKGSEPVYLRLPLMPGRSKPQTVPHLGVVRSYPAALNEIVELKPHMKTHADFPVAKKLADAIVTLPTHQYVTQTDQEKILNALSTGKGKKTV